MRPLRSMAAVAVLALACSPERVRRDEVQVELGEAGQAVEGHWYGSDGSEELVIERRDGTYEATVVWPHDFEYRLVRAAFASDSVHFWIERQGEREEKRMRWIEGDDWMIEPVQPPIRGHAYFLTKDPSSSWHQARAAERVLEQGKAHAERLVDWLVRNL